VKTRRPEFFDHELKRKDFKLDNLVESETQALCVMEAHIFKRNLLKQMGNFLAYLQLHIFRSFNWMHLLQNGLYCLNTLSNAYENLEKYNNVRFVLLNVRVKKGKAVPLQAWGGPECSRKLRFPNVMTTAQDGGKIVNLTHRPSLPQRKTPGTHFY
jgi:hypothetical protein